jgi:hypothetical protein
MKDDRRSAMKSQGRSYVNPLHRLLLGVLAIVAATSVGFAAGDALAAPHKSAATIAGHSGRGVMDYDWSWHLAPGQMIELEGVNGEIRATGTAGKDVVVHARKHARHSDPDKVTIEVIEHADGITLCVRYPDVWGSRPNTCAPHGNSHMSTHDNDVNVDFVVQVPAGVRLAARTVNGAVEAHGLDADAEAHTVNGSVTLETRGRAEATTVNGAVRARLGSMGVRESLDFSTVNGSITLELPEDANAEVTARNVNGGIETDFPITIRRAGFVGHRLNGTIGRGGPRLELSTVNGSIHLRKVRSL